MSEPPPKDRQERRRSAKSASDDDERAGGRPDEGKEGQEGRHAKAGEERRRSSKGTDEGRRLAEAKPADSPAAEPKRFNANTIWALVTGLAIGFAVGREAHRLGGGSSDAPSAASASAEAVAPSADGPKVYRSLAEFPANWVKDDLPALAGLTAQQKVTVLQALNERNCECGCPFGSLANCLHKDPNCPRSPQLAKVAVDLAKQGKGLPEILAAIDEKQKEMSQPSAQQPAAPTGPVRVEIAPHNARKGPKAAKVTIVEFSDFQCPFCQKAGPLLKQIEETYGKDVAIVFKHQPLPFHDRAMDAAIAFQAANKQGKAWQLHDKMFANQQALSVADLERYAKEIGLDVARFKKDMADPKVKDEVLADQKVAGSVGANGTPTFFINGRQIVGAQPFEQFKAIIDEELKAADELIRSGTPLAEVYDKRTQR